MVLPLMTLDPNLQSKRVFLAYKPLWREWPESDPIAYPGLVGIVFWIRLFQSLKVSSSMGPLVLTMGEIFYRDVSRFLVVLAALMLGFGAAFVCAARPYPDNSWRCAENLKAMKASHLK